MMTPERLAECPHTNLWWAGCVSCGARFQDIIAAQRTHIRDLEAQLAAAREFIREETKRRHYTIDVLTQRMECGASLGTSIDTCERCNPWRLMLSKLYTATPPSPEVGE